MRPSGLGDATSAAPMEIAKDRTSADPLLNVSQLTAGYAGFVVLRTVDVSLSAGSILTLVGPNGSGKSTFAKSILGLVAKYGGRVQFDGVDITKLSTYAIARQGVGYVPQVEDVFPSLTVAENLEIPCLSGLGSSKIATEHVYDTLPSIYPLRKRRASHLSGGERRMVSVARALVTKPRLMIADEPSSNLAPAMAQRVWEELRRIADSGTAVLAVEQNVGLALDFSDSVSVLVEGSLRASEIPVKSIDLTEIFRLFMGSAQLSELVSDVKQEVR